MAIRMMVPLDGSALSESALPHAVELARQIDARIDLVRVHHMLGMEGFVGVDYIACVQNEPEILEIERAYLRRLKHNPDWSDVIEGAALLTGNVVSALCDFVEREQIDLVVMATHGRGGLSRAMMGSVADALIRRVEVPVLLLRSGDERFAWPVGHDLQHVLIPVDGSYESRFMADVAISLLGHQLRYTLFEVSEHDIVPTRTNVADAICEFARNEKVDLIAMATGGRSGWTRWLEGSVGASLIHDSPVPIMLLTTAAMNSVKLAGV